MSQGLGVDAIDAVERDASLTLGRQGWPQSLDAATKTHLERNGWILGSGIMSRDLLELTEFCVRFPSAPIFGINRKTERAVIAPRFDCHTARVLIPRKHVGSPTERVFLFHNGLNELDDFGLFYDLAARIMLEGAPDGGQPTACLLRPLPGHLTRFPFVGPFVEKPLDTYLNDAGDLFRQFIKYMVETGWLLSVLSPYPRIPTMVGGQLLVDHVSRGGGDHTDSAVLADAILTEWNSISGRSVTSYQREPLTHSLIQQCVQTLRELLGWRPATDVAPPEGIAYPSVHNVGYSLGGFMAQTGYFAWPQLISSCTTLLSGGPLSEINLVAFAHHEEWKTVVHALRYEIDDMAMSGRLKADDDDSLLAGVPREDFEYFRRLFYEVFVREHRGTYATRLAEHSQRLLFVQGGGDSIVRTQNVLDAAPPDGVNLVQVAGLPHFIERSKLGPDQTLFWIPQVGRLAHAFAIHAEELHGYELRLSWLDESTGRPIPEEPSPFDDVAAAFVAPRPARPPTVGPLDAESFGPTMGRLLDNAKDAGWLLAARNTYPTSCLDPVGIRRRAVAIHHRDERVRQYMASVDDRHHDLVSLRPRFTLIVPETLNAWWIKATSDYSSRSETPGGLHLSPDERATAQVFFDATWTIDGALRWFTPAMLTYAEQLCDDELVRVHLNLRDCALRRAGEAVTHLPDAWLSFSHEALYELSQVFPPFNRAVPTDRDDLEKKLACLAGHLGTGDDADKDIALKFASLVADEKIMIVKVSAAAYNPRYRGERVRDPRRSALLLEHWAYAFVLSTRVSLGGK